MNSKQNQNFISYKLRLKSIFAHYCSDFDEIKNKIKTDPNTDNYLKWNILKRGFLQKDLSKTDKELLFNIVRFLRNYNSHSYYDINVKSELNNQFKSNILSWLYKDRDKSKIPKIYVFLDELISLMEKGDELAQWTLMLFYSSIVLYKQEYNNLKSQILSFFKTFKTSERLNWAKQFQDYYQCFENETEIKIDRYRSPYIKNKTLFALRIIKQFQFKEILSLDNLKNWLIKTAISFKWIVQFWDFFLLDESSKNIIDLKLRRIYYCADCYKNLDLTKNWSEVLCKDIKGIFFCWGEHKKQKKITCQKWCNEKGCKTYFYCKTDNDYDISRRGKIFKFQVNNFSFIISYKSAKHLLLLMLLEAYKSPKNEKDFLNNLKEKFHKFISKCLICNSDDNLVKEFIAKLDPNSNEDWDEMFIKNSNKLTCFKNRTYIKKYYFQNQKQNSLFFQYDFDKKKSYSIIEFWENRRKFKIQKLEIFLQNLETKKSSLKDGRNYNSFKELSPKQDSDEIRIRLSFVFSTINSLYLKSSLDSDDFDSLFSSSFDTLLNETKQNSFNIYSMIKELLLNKKNKELLTIWSEYPKIFHNFNLQNFDYCFKELIKEKIKFFQKKINSKVLEDSFFNSVLKVKKSDLPFNDNFFIKNIKINYSWLTNFYLNNEKNNKLKDFFEKNLNNKIFKFYQLDKKQGQKNAEQINLETSSNLYLKFDLTLRYFLIQIFKIFLLDHKEKKNIDAVKIEIDENIDNFFQSKINYHIKNLDSLGQYWIIVFNGFRNFKIEELEMYKLNKPEYLNFVFKEKKNIENNKMTFEELKRKRNLILFKQCKFSCLKKDTHFKFQTLVYQILNLENKKTTKPQNRKYIRKEGYINFGDLFPDDKLLCDTRYLLLHRKILNCEHKKILFKYFESYLISCSKQ